jgi:hypothetical protein
MEVRIAQIELPLKTLPSFSRHKFDQPARNPSFFQAGDE